MAARSTAFSANNIEAGFAVTGLIPYDPDRVLPGLNTGVGNINPPEQNLRTNWVPENTPQPH